MSQLSPAAVALVRVGRIALRPTASDRARNSAALRSRLGGVVVPFTRGHWQAPLPHRSGWLTFSARAVAVGVAGGALLLAGQDVFSRALKPQEIQVARIVETPVAPQPFASAIAPIEPAAPRAKGVEVVARPQDRLAREVAILSRATSELHAGRAANALRAADEHQRKFPNGSLAFERRAARVQALCALNRHHEAEAELEWLARVAPNSATTLRAREACSRARSL